MSSWVDILQGLSYPKNTFWFISLKKSRPQNLSDIRLKMGKARICCSLSVQNIRNVAETIFEYLVCKSRVFVNFVVYWTSVRPFKREKLPRYTQ